MFLYENVRLQMVTYMSSNCFLVTEFNVLEELVPYLVDFFLAQDFGV